MNSIRERLAALEQGGAFGPCALCDDGRSPVVSHWHVGDRKPTDPPACGMCGRPRLHIVIQYVDQTAEVAL